MSENEQQPNVPNNVDPSTTTNYNSDGVKNNIKWRDGLNVLMVVGLGFLFWIILGLIISPLVMMTREKTTDDVILQRSRRPVVTQF